jgi:hypothetical protein
MKPSWYSIDIATCFPIRMHSLITSPGVDRDSSCERAISHLYTIFKSPSLFTIRSSRQISCFFHLPLQVLHSASRNFPPWVSLTFLELAPKPPPLAQRRFPSLLVRQSLSDMEDILLPPLIMLHSAIRSKSLSMLILREERENLPRS